VVRHAEREIHIGQLEVHVLSFGFKYGIPLEADLVVDVRFLPNPYFIPELKELDGTSPQVEKFVRRWDETSTFLKNYLDLLDFLTPLYQKEGKSYLTIAIGCTGGRHRSVVVANSDTNASEVVAKRKRSTPSRILSKTERVEVEVEVAQPRPVEWGTGHDSRPPG